MRKYLSDYLFTYLASVKLTQSRHYTLDLNTAGVKRNTSLDIRNSLRKPVYRFAYSRILTRARYYGIIVNVKLAVYKHTVYLTCKSIEAVSCLCRYFDLMLEAFKHIGKLFKGVTEVAKRFAPNGIMTLATDMPMRSIAAASKVLSLPGISPEMLDKDAADSLAFQRYMLDWK